MMRRIDNMTREQIVLELVRIASYCSCRFQLDEAASTDSVNPSVGLREQGEAIGRREVCARIADYFATSFGISVKGVEV